MDDNLSSAVLEGHVSIEAALRGRSRPIHKLLVHKDWSRRSQQRLSRLLRQHDIPIEYVSAEELNSYSHGETHGGVIALAGQRDFVSIAELVQNSTCPFVVMLDGVEDPFNFGSAIRALYAAGADGLVVRPRNWFSATGIVAKASAGASELIPTALVETAEDAALALRPHGLRIACTGKAGATSLYESNLQEPLFLVIGGEKRGITRSFIEQADILIEIPYGRSYQQSLGTTAAASILGFEIMRQRSLNRKEEE